MSTTVLLISTDEAALLRHSLPAAAAQDGAHVVVIDNGSTDDTEAVARGHGAEYVRLPERLLYTRAANAALEHARDDAVLLLNPDCFLEPGFLAAARPRLDEPGVGCVAPRLVRALGPHPSDRLDALDAAGMVIDRRRKNTLVGHGRPALAYDLPGEAFGVDGAAALYRRETLEDCRVAGEIFDTDMERWASDVDLAWRMRLLGWRCAYEPRAVARHIRFYSPSTREQMPAHDRRMQFRNRYLMMLKNETGEGLLRDLPRIAAYELLALGYALVHERELLGAYADAARLAPGALRRRRELQSRVRSRGRVAVPFGLEPAL